MSLLLEGVAVPVSGTRVLKSKESRARRVTAIRGCKTFTLFNPNIIPRPLSHGRIFGTGIRSCWIPFGTITKRNIRDIYDWSKCTVFDTPEPKLMQHTDYNLAKRSQKIEL